MAHLPQQLRAVGRQVSEVLMLEPACGMRWPAAHAPYTRLESLWNQRSFWACLQVSQQHASAAQGSSVMSHLSFELEDTSKWEALFLPLAPQVVARCRACDQPMQWPDVAKACTHLQ